MLTRRFKTLFSISSIDRDFHTGAAQCTAITFGGTRSRIRNNGEYEQSI